MELFIFARFHAHPGNESTVAEALHAALVPTREEPSCLSIHAFRSMRDSIHGTRATQKNRRYR